MSKTPPCPTIVIAYFTGSGHTRRLAEVIAAGAGRARLVDVESLDAEDWQALDSAGAIVFGTPTYMGSSAARFDVFLEEASDRWPGQVWADKIAAGFTVATYASGDKLITLQRLSIYAAQMGMIWVGQAEIGAPVDVTKPGINHSGSWLGLMAQSSCDKGQMIEADDLETAKRFGARISGAVNRWN